MPKKQEQKKKKKFLIFLPFIILAVAAAAVIPPVVIFTRKTEENPTPTPEPELQPEPEPEPEPVYIETFKFSGDVLLGFNDKITEELLKERFPDGNLIIPECSSISENAFNGTIPSFITSITFTSVFTDVGDNAFSNNKSINVIDVSVFESVPTWTGKDIFINSNVSGQVEVLNRIKKDWKTLFESNSGLKIHKEYWVIGHNIFDLVNCPSVYANSDSTITINRDSGNMTDVKYSFGSNEGTAMEGTINIPAGETLYLWGDNEKGFSSSEGCLTSFTIKGDVELGGNVMGLLSNGYDTEDTIPCDCCFNSLFIYSPGIKKVSKNFLPATNLTNKCYKDMFSSVSFLQEAPDLPATVMKESCYEQMFKNTQIVSTPELPSTELAPSCYKNMFCHCYKMTHACDLPATVVPKNAYQGMFFECSKLETSPVIKGTELSDYCFAQMFSSCINLKKITVKFKTWITGVTLNWVSRVSEAGEFVCDSNLENISGDSNIPSGWDVKVAN